MTPYALGILLFFGFVMRLVDYSLVEGLAVQSGAVEVFWRESWRSFSGFVAECWFSSGADAGLFAQRYAAVVGRSVLVRVVSGSAPGGWCVSAPCVVPCGSVVLRGGQRGGRVRVDMRRG